MTGSEAFPPPGQLVQVNGRQLHLNCTGVGTPTVILEAGLGVGASMSWAPVQDTIARFTRVCSYDRAGLLWSDPRQGARNAATVASELAALARDSRCRLTLCHGRSFIRRALCAGFYGARSTRGRWRSVRRRRSSPELCVKVRGSSSMLLLGCLGDLLRFEKREIQVATFAPDRSSP